jgi:hypothetical protein
MRGLFSLRLLPASLLTALLTSGLSGCTTEAACFDDCTGVVGNVGGSSGSGPNDIGGSLNLGGDPGSEPGIGGTNVNVGGGRLEDAGMACDGVDLETDVNNCGTCGNVCIFTGADAMCLKGECVLTECFDDATTSTAIRTTAASTRARKPWIRPSSATTWTTTATG